MAVLFQPAPENTITEVFPTATNGLFSLEEIQTYVGGSVEAIRMDNGDVMYINEEGKLNQLNPNLEATVYARGGSDLFDQSRDVIVGPAILCKAANTKRPETN